MEQLRCMYRSHVLTFSAQNPKISSGRGWNLWNGCDMTCTAVQFREACPEPLRGARFLFGTFRTLSHTNISTQTVDEGTEFQNTQPTFINNQSTFLHAPCGLTYLLAHSCCIWWRSLSLRQVGTKSFCVCQLLTFVCVSYPLALAVEARSTLQLTGKYEDVDK